MRSGKALLILCLILALPSLAFAQAWPNEPAGSVALFDCGFNHPTCNGNLQDPYNTANTLPNPPSANTLSVVTDTSAPVSPPSVLKSQGNAATGTGGTELHYVAPSLIKEVYVGFWWRTNPEFTGNQINANKTFFIRGTQGGQNGVFYLRTNPGQNKFLYWSTQLPYNLNQCFGAPDQDHCYPNITTTPIVPGTWYRVEVYMKASTCPTCRDGAVRWWINGVLNGNYSNFAYGPFVNEWVWSETWDGAGNGAGFTSNPAHFIDHLHISLPTGSGGVAPNPDTPAGPPAVPTGLNAQKVTP